MVTRRRSAGPGPIVTAPAGTTCTFTGTGTLTPALTCNDQATVNVTLTVSDGINPAVSDTAVVTIANAVPVVAPPTITPNPAAVGALDHPHRDVHRRGQARHAHRIHQLG